jgi:hypothetical protein
MVLICFFIGCGFLSTSAYGAVRQPDASRYPATAARYDPYGR